MLFLPYQSDFISDSSRLVLVEKGRQIGLSYAAAYKAVRLVADGNARLDVWVASRDEIQSRQFLRYCRRWARSLDHVATLSEQCILLPHRAIRVQALKFTNGLCIYCLSSNPDAIVGKSGHVILDEFALHRDQRQLYTVAKPVTQWGGTLTLLSTHRGIGTVFNELISDARQCGNKMGWSLHTIPIQKAVDQGIVEKIHRAAGQPPARTPAAIATQRQAWLARQRAECIDEEQWLQEYCCQPADETTAFITYEMIVACEDPSARRDFTYLATLPSTAALYIGFDVARTTDLSVIDVEEKVGDVFCERLRLELRGKTFAEQEYELRRLLDLPTVRRCCIDATGIGMQLAENMVARYGLRAEAIRFTGPVKEELAYPLRAAHEDRRLRYPPDEPLRADLRGVKKETTASGNPRFAGETADSHCDRFWAKALALHAGKTSAATQTFYMFNTPRNHRLAESRTLLG